MKRAIISVGSNIDPEQNIARAKQILDNEQILVNSSTFVTTAPQGFTEQNDFSNGAFDIETELELQPLRDYLKKIEHRLGRVRTENKNAPRTIDLDVVVYEGQVVDADFEKYDFVKNAVLELMPELQGE